MMSLSGSDHKSGSKNSVTSTKVKIESREGSNSRNPILEIDFNRESARKTLEDSIEELDVEIS